MEKGVLEIASCSHDHVTDSLDKTQHSDVRVDEESELEGERHDEVCKPESAVLRADARVKVPGVLEHTYDIFHSADGNIHSL